MPMPKYKSPNKNARVADVSLVGTRANVVRHGAPRMADQTAAGNVNTASSRNTSNYSDLNQKRNKGAGKDMIS